MTACLPSTYGVVTTPAASSKTQSALAGASIGVFRLPTDPLFYADLKLQNIVSGSRYRVIVDDTGEELATGVAGSTEVTLTGLAVYANPQLVAITVRNASGSPTYKVFDTKASMGRGTTNVYIGQILDE